jgi:dUTP pyrophosphatase
MTVPIKYYSSNEDVTLKFETPGAAGLDLRTLEARILRPGGTFKCDTGIHVEIPEGYFGLVAPRSSTGKLGLRLRNTVGIIDSDYRGPIILSFRNDGDSDVQLEKGQRLAQLIVSPYLGIEPIQVDLLKNLSSTHRGVAGFGSTGE